MPRHTAFRVLRSGSPTPLREVDREAARSGLDGRDRALVRRLVGTEVRRRGTLRALVAAFARGKPSAGVATHLRLGITQLFFLDRVPKHAAVGEQVRAAMDTLGIGRGRYVNAVLRAVQGAGREGSSGDPRRDLVGRDLHMADPLFRDPAEHPFLWIEDALSIPASLAKRWEKRYGRERTLELARGALEEPRLSVRVVRGERAALAEELAALGPVDPDGTGETAHPRVLVFPSSATTELLDSAAFQEGRITVQGETALRAAELVQAADGERVLDLCAAPGGKTAVLAATGARVVAVDVSARRLARLGPGLLRLGPPGAVDLVAADGAGALTATDFDAALVDAPCSNTGVLAARPGARWRYGPSAQTELSTLQGRLLRSAAERVRPGGRLVYSTCSLEPEENRLRVRAFLEECPAWTLDEEIEALPSAEGPGPVDGGYAARLVRSEGAPG